MSEVFAAGAWRSLTRAELYIGGKWRTVTRAEYWNGSSWKQAASFVPPLSVAVSPATASGSAMPLKPQPQVVSTGALTATPSGGKAPFAYSWSIISHTGSLPSLGNSAVASTIATATVAANTDQTAIAQVTVTDALGSTASATGTFSFSNHSQIGG